MHLFTLKKTTFFGNFLQVVYCHVKKFCNFFARCEKFPFQKLHVSKKVVLRTAFNKIAYIFIALRFTVSLLMWKHFWTKFMSKRALFQASLAPLPKFNFKTRSVSDSPLLKDARVDTPGYAFFNRTSIGTVENFHYSFAVTGFR